MRKKLFDGSREAPKSQDGRPVRDASVSSPRSPPGADSAPALVLVGDADIADVIAYGGAIEAALPIVSFEVWKNCGHLIQLEKPAELVARFERFAALADCCETAVPAAELRDLAGEYKCFNRSIAISLKNDRLWLRLPDPTCA